MYRVILISILLIIIQFASSCALPVSRGVMHVTLGQSSNCVSRKLNCFDAYFADSVNLDNSGLSLADGNKTILVLSAFYPQKGYLTENADVYHLIVLMDSIVQMNETINLPSDKLKILFCYSRYLPKYIEASSNIVGKLVFISKSSNEITGYIVFSGQTMVISMPYVSPVYGYVDCQVNFKATKINKKRLSSYLNNISVLYSSRLRELLR